MSPEDFINLFAPIAIENMKKTNIPASFLVAQAALESGWGTSKLYLNGKNVFGIKAGKSWEGSTLTMNTKEYDKEGKEYREDAKWRKYEDIADCVADHAAYLKGHVRYQPAFIHKCGGDQFANYIAAGGYATDPLYAHKIQSIIHKNNLLALDEEGDA